MPNPLEDYRVDKAIAEANKMLRLGCRFGEVETWLKDECQFKPAEVKAIMYDLTRLEKYVWRAEG